MFSKSKRFPEVGKDYIPGPGEYEVVMDDSSPYKRHGFISQTNRFSDILDIPNNISNECLVSQQRSNYGYKSDSTASSLSLSSTASSFDETSTTTRSFVNAFPTGPKKQCYSPTSPDRIAMQKELETLQSKARKMELHIQSLENEKNDTKTAILTKDLELAQMRSKNTTLQKTINRQKMTQLQKKVVVLENHIQTTERDHKTTLDEKNDTIESLRRQMEELQTQQLARQASMEASVDDLTARLAASEHDVHERQMLLNQLRNESQCMAESIRSLHQRISEHESELANLSTEKDGLLHQVDEFKKETAHLKSCVSGKDEEIRILSDDIHEKNNEMRETSILVEQLNSRFTTYREYIEKTVVPYLRTKRQQQEEHRLQEHHRVLTELYEAKKFINKQAQQLDGLKSDVHWLNSHIYQVAQIMALTKKTTAVKKTTTKAHKKPSLSKQDNGKLQQTP